MYDDMYLVSYKVLVYRDYCILIFRDTVYWYTGISQTVLMHIALARFLLLLLRLTSLHFTAHCSIVTPPPPKQQSCPQPQAAVCHRQQSETLKVTPAPHSVSLMMAPAFFSWPPDSFLLIHASCHMLPASCLLPQSSFLLSPVSFLLPHLLLDHSKFFVHCLKMVSVETRPIKHLLEVPQGDLAHCTG